MPTRKFNNQKEAIKFISDRKSLPALFTSAVKVNSGNPEGGLFITLDGGHATLARLASLTLNSLAGGHSRVTGGGILFGDSKSKDSGQNLDRHTHDGARQRGITVCYEDR